jgi:hypothetical protein
LGPILGGALAQPCDSYPNLFPRGTIFDKFPFLLPNLFCAAVVIFGVLIGFLFIEETHPERRFERDAGRELGKRLTRLVLKTPAQMAPMLEKTADITPETISLIDGDEDMVGYLSTESSPQIPIASPVDDFEVLRLDPAEPVTITEKAVPQKAFTRQVVLNIVAFGIAA